MLLVSPYFRKMQKVVNQYNSIIQIGCFPRLAWCKNDIGFLTKIILSDTGIVITTKLKMKKVQIDYLPGWTFFHDIYMHKYLFLSGHLEEFNFSLLWRGNKNIHER